ncbi:MAG: PQQ-binding-like beta-propeller repeat protein [Planctomycetota bacterium]
MFLLFIRSLHTLLLGLALLAPAAAAESTAAWPHLLGPDFTTRTAPGVPGLDGLADVRRMWTAQVGTGFSAFAVADGHAVTAGWSDDTTTVTCFDAESGAVTWTHAYPCTLQPKWGAIGAPTILADAVYVLGKEGQLFCLDLDSGHVRWQRDLATDHAVSPQRWGFSCAPTPHQGTLLLNAGDAGMAVDARTGETIWASEGSGASYATVTVTHLPQGPRALIFTAAGLKAVDPATGTVDWLVPWTTKHDINASAPQRSGDRLFISSGYGTGAGIVDLAGGHPELVWTATAPQTQMAGGVLIDGHLYAVDAHRGKPGRLVCVAIADGATRWAADGFGQGSLIAAGDRLLVLTGDGELVLAKADPTSYEELGRTRVLDGTCWTPPALSGDRLYVRNQSGACAAWRLTP